MPPPHTMRCAEESQKLPIITLSLSPVRPICAVMIWAFEGLMAALAGKIMAPIIFNELHQEVSIGPAITRTKTRWEAALLSCHQNGCEFVWSQRTLLSLFSAAGFERTKKGSSERNKPESVPVPFAWAGCIYEQLSFMESINSAEWNLLFHRFSIPS